MPRSQEIKIKSQNPAERVTTSKYARRRQTEEELKGGRGTHIKDNRTNYRACRFVMQSSNFFTWGVLRTETQHAPSRTLRGGAFSRTLRDNGRIVKRTIERVTTSKYERRRRTEEELKGERGTHIKDNRTNYRACRFVMQSSYFFTWGAFSLHGGPCLNKEMVMTTPTDTQ